MSVLLKKPIFKDVSQTELVQQLEAIKKCRKKLPLWFSTSKIYYPNKLNIEQSSSEKTAEYKSKIIHGKSLVDITGGFGVDSYFLSKRIKSVIYCEIDDELSAIASHNFGVLKIKNIDVVQDDALRFLKNSKQHFDWIYADPSRRNEAKGKVFKLSDCLPNIVKHLDALFDKSENILIKTSPLLDISAGVNELRFVREVHSVAVNNEVKELLWVLQNGYSGPMRIKTANLKKEGDETFDFLWNEEKNTNSELSPALEYLYEPNAAILKAGAFKQTGQGFGIKKLNEHTHLYTSKELVDFPGRRFKVLKKVGYNKKKLQRLRIEKANITTRNFPESVASIRKKLKIKDGGDMYLFFTTNLEEKHIVLQCSKI